MKKTIALAAALTLVAGSAFAAGGQPVYDATLNNFFNANSVGAATQTVNQVSVTTSATLLSAARTGALGTGRKALTICDNGTANLEYGPTNAITTSTGSVLVPGQCGTFNYTGAEYGISSTTITVSVTETY